MKILIISNLYPSSTEVGDQTRNMLLHHYARHWVKYHQLTVINPHSYNLLEIFSRELVDESFKLDGIKVYNRSVLRLPGGFLIKNKFKSVVDVTDYDVMIGCLPVGLEIANYLSKRFNIPYISYLHITDFYRSGIRKNRLTNKYHNFLQNTLGIAFISSNLQSTFQNHLTHQTNHYILPGAISKEWVEAVNNRTFDFSDSVKIVTPSRIIPRKNIELILESLQILADSKFKFTLAGHREDAQKLVRKCHDKDLLHRTVSLVGMKTHPEIRELMDKNDLMILLSINESFGLVYLEAMARGCIVIGTAGEGIDGVIQDGKNGFLCEPTVEALVNLIKQLCAMSSSQLTSISINAVETAKEYIYQKQADLFTNYVSKCLSNR